MKLSWHLPTWASITLSVLAAVLVGFNVTTFGFPPAWQYLVTIGGSVIAAFGISPLTGPALQTALHMSHQAVVALTSIIATANVAITTLSMSSTLKGVLIGVLTLAAGIVLGEPVPAPAVTPAPAPAAPPAPATPPAAGK